MSNIYIFTGAGISAPSGIPTFRDAGGIWEKYDLKEVCNFNNWKKNRNKVFEFYNKLSEKYEKAEPNEAHLFVANLQRDYGKDRVKIFTQNVDNLLEKAGCENVIHLHGKVGHLQCTACGNVFENKIDVEARCPNCASLKGVKPFVVMFGEKAPNYKYLHHCHKQLKRSDIFMIIGTNGIVVNLTDIMNNPKYVSYHETNYFLNVMDENNQYHQIPNNENYYGIESCITFLPKTRPYIDAIMNGDSLVEE